MTATPAVLLATTVDPTRIGGVQRNLAMISRRLEAEGAATTFVARPVIVSEEHRRSTLRRAWRRLHPDSEELFRLNRSIEGVAEQARSGRFGVALAFDAWAAIGTVESGVPTVFRAPSTKWMADEWRANNFLRNDSRAFRRLAARERDAVLGCARVVSLSTSGQHFYESLGMPADRLLVIPNGIDVSEWALPEKDAPGERVRLVWVAKLRKRKALPDLAHALAAMSAEARARVHLDVYGAGNDEHNPCYTRSASVLDGAAVSNDFHGPVETDVVKHALLSADAFVLSSHSEGMSNAILEAMAAGLPVVATRAGATAEMIAPEAADLLVDIGDVPALSAALERVVGDAGLRQRAGRANRARVEGEYAADRIGERYLAALREAAD